MHKKQIFIMISVFLFLLMFSSLSFAYSITYEEGVTYQSVIKFGSTTATTLGGGAFTFSSNIPDNSSFQSFCVETDETISGGTYNASISSTADMGGSNTDSGDPLSIGTAWLYSQFATGELDDVNLDYAKLQFAIWALEDELNASEYSNYENTSNEYLIAVISEFGSFANAQADSGYGEYGVYVLNLTDSSGNYRQDQLVYIPTVPIPGSILLLGSGLIGLVGIRRRLYR